MQNRKNRTVHLAVLAAAVMLSAVISGCGGKMAADSDDESVGEVTANGYKAHEDNVNRNICEDGENIAELCQDICNEAVSEHELGSLETAQHIVRELGQRGYTAVDSENQIDMTEPQQVRRFCEAVDGREEAELTIIVVSAYGGVTEYGLRTQDGKVTAGKVYYRYNNGRCEKQTNVSYDVDSWQYTEDGYLIFAGSHYSEESYVLTMSDVPEITALRVEPLDAQCRALNRRYILPVGYRENNMFLCDWSEEDYGELDFYDIFDRFYPEIYGQQSPYVADQDISVGAVYHIPEKEFERVIEAHFLIDSAILHDKTGYSSENEGYEYRPRGFYEAEYPNIPFPEVVGYTENSDGTVTLTVHAVYPEEGTSRAFTHEVVVRPLEDGGFRYVSNRRLPSRDDFGTGWHTNRLTREAWEEIYGGESLFTEEEKAELEKQALTAAKQAAVVYQDVEIAGNAPFESNIAEFTRQQCIEVVALLGKAGYVSVTDDVNMENYEKVLEFYEAYLKKCDAQVTIHDVSRDGLIGAVTFLYREGRLQTCYVGIGWEKGGIPVKRDVLVSDITEMKLTGKGYLIYAYKNNPQHTSLRQYWRVKPLSDELRKLTKKYVSGLSYVNYNVLVTNWDSGNVEDVLAPCMFEDIYRIYSGENLKVENGRIPAKLYEKVMMTYFPVTENELRQACGYDEESDSYPYEMIFHRQYPPFGEVVDHRDHSDGTITLIVDGVWADYDSDCAFTNEIVVQPFSDGTFRYLSNHVEEKELELPLVDG